MGADPSSRCADARRLLGLAPTSAAHRRGSAVLARQAVEAAARLAMGRQEVRELAWKTRFLVLANLFPAIDARRGHTIWSNLSRVCHYEHYDLLPSGAVIERMLDETDAWVAVVQAAIPTAPPRFRPESLSQPTHTVTP